MYLWQKCYQDFLRYLQVREDVDTIALLKYTTKFVSFPTRLVNGQKKQFHLVGMTREYSLVLTRLVKRLSRAVEIAGNEMQSLYKISPWVGLSYYGVLRIYVYLLTEIYMWSICFLHIYIGVSSWRYKRQKQSVGKIAIILTEREGRSPLVERKIIDIFFFPTHHSLGFLLC